MVDVSNADELIAEARSSLADEMQVQLLIGGQWLSVTEVIRISEIGLARAEQQDGSMTLFDPACLAAVRVKGS